jgi:hypothetical protein
MLAACAGNAQPPGSTSSYDAVSLASSSVAAMYRALNAAVVDSYVAGALLDPRRSIGAGQPCIDPDNSLGSRPSPLVNPPLAESSIEQRSRLAETLGTYDVALASFVEAEPSAASRVATSELQRSVFELSVAANAHAQGDLFIEDLAAKLAASAARLAAAPNRGAVRLIARDASPTIRKLTAVLAADVAKRHAEGLNAASADYESWLAYYETARRDATGGGSGARTSAALPRCFAPSVPQSGPSPGAGDVASDGASFPGRDAILARVEAARRRYAALSDTSPTALLSALSTLDDALDKALESPGEAQAAGDVQSALQNYREAARELAAGFRSL